MTTATAQRALPSDGTEFRRGDDAARVKDAHGETTTPSPCDSCARPGACCTGFALTSGGLHGTPLERTAFLAKQGLPFVPLYLSPKGFWRWWCPLLGRDGRCSSYEDRPDVCRQYRPKSDSLCVMHEPKEGES